MNQVGVGPGLIAGGALAGASLVFTVLVAGASADSDNIGWLYVFPVGVVGFLVAGVVVGARVGPPQGWIALGVLTAATTVLGVTGLWLCIVWSAAAALGLAPVALVRSIAALRR